MHERLTVAECPRWCDEPAGHQGKHRVYIGEVPTKVAGTFVAVTVEAPPMGRTPEPVLSVGFVDHAAYAATRLSWSGCEQLAGLLLDTKRRYA